MKTLFIRGMFACLGVCALVFAFEFAKSFSTMLLANNISTIFFTSLLFTMTSVGASMIAFYAMRNAEKLNAKKRLAYGVAYVVMLLPAVMVALAMNQIAKEKVPLESKQRVTEVNSEF